MSGTTTTTTTTTTITTAATATTEGIVPCSSTGITIGMTALAAYMATIKFFRFRRVRSMKMSDAKDNPSSVYRKTTMLEFPFLVTKAIDFGFLRTWGIPSISRLVYASKQFKHNVGKRYDDTDILLKEYVENEPTSDRANSAIARINAIHQVYSKDISNAHMLYSLSLFITEPINWIDRFGWRRATDVEKEGFLAHFKVMGEKMGIKGMDTWKTWDDAYAHQMAYEAEHFAYSDTTNELVTKTLELLLSPIPWYLAFLRPLCRISICALMDKPLLQAIGMPESPWLMKWFVQSALLTWAMIIRYLSPPRFGFLACRRTPYVSIGDISSSSAAETFRGGSKGSDTVPEGAADVLRCTRFDYFTDKKLGCLFYANGYRIKDVGTAACPAGRLLSGRPTYAGTGGGGSGTGITRPHRITTK